MNKIDSKILFLKETDSTNSFLKRNYRNYDSGTVVVAEKQLSGKGSSGRIFYSDIGGLYVSFLLKPPYTFPVNMITPLAAVAAFKTLELFGCPSLSVKWVNDIYSFRKKICGILTESVVSQNSFDCVIVGIGINVCTPENNFNAAISDIACSLFKYSDKNAVKRVLYALIKEFFTLYESASLNEIADFYAEHSLLKGKFVTVKSGNSVVSGICKGFNSDCNIIIASQDGEKIISSGSVISFDDI